MIYKSYEYEKLKNSISSKRIFLLYGENYGLKKDIKEITKSMLNKKNVEVEELSLLENEVIKNEENFYNFIFSGSLFSNIKTISIHNASDKIVKHIENVIDKFPEDVSLILFAEVLDKKSKLRILFEKNENIVCIPCYLDNEKSLKIIAVNELKKNGMMISNESLNLVVGKSNGDRNNLRNELEKIKSFLAKGKKIEYDQIKYLVNSSTEIKNENLVNICLSGEILELKKILQELSIESINQILLLKILGNKIRRLLTIKNQNDTKQNLDSLINSVKPPIFWKEKSIVRKQLTVWKINDLKNMIYQINNIEISCKKNPRSSAPILFNFLTGLCKKASC